MMNLGASNFSVKLRFGSNVCIFVNEFSSVSQLWRPRSLQCSGLNFQSNGDPYFRKRTTHREHNIALSDVCGGDVFS